MPRSKQEFDKEYIYNLIMPTNSPSPSEPEPAGPEDPPDDGLQDSLSLLKAKLPEAQGTVHLNTHKKPDLVNLTERLVVEKLDDAFEKFNCCKCDKCRMDTAAIALNLLPPHYVVAEPGEIQQLLKDSSTKEISAAIVKAILQVKSHPRH